MHGGTHCPQLATADGEVHGALQSAALTRRHARCSGVDQALDHCILLFLGQVFILGLPLLTQRMDGLHHRIVVETHARHATAHASVILEVNRKRGTSPREAEH
ncbi:hypothetical protein D3C72_2185490 [compost metagenome]